MKSNGVHWNAIVYPNVMNFTKGNLHSTKVYWTSKGAILVPEQSHDSYTWILPDKTMTNSSAIVIQESGNYTLIVKDNNCTAITSTISTHTLFD